MTPANGRSNVTKIQGVTCDGLRIPSLGCSNTPSRFMLQKPELLQAPARPVSHLHVAMINPIFYLYYTVCVQRRIKKIKSNLQHINRHYIQ